MLFSAQSLHLHLRLGRGLVIFPLRHEDIVLSTLNLLGRGDEISRQTAISNPDLESRESGTSTQQAMNADGFRARGTEPPKSRTFTVRSLQLKPKPTTLQRNGSRLHTVTPFLCC